MTMSSVEHWTAAAGVLAAPFYLSLIIVLGALEPGFSHLSSPMSMLGGVPDGRGLAFNLGVTATGVLLIAFTVGLQRQLPSRRSVKVGTALLMIGGLGLIGAGMFPCNQNCQNILIEPDTIGRLHIMVSLCAGIGTGLALFFIWAGMRCSVTWKNWATLTLWVAILANLPGITFWITIATGLRLQTIEGLIQRAGFVIVLIWMFLVAVRMKWLASRNKALS